MTKEELIAFEKRVAEAFANKEIKGPTHLSGGNEDQLIEIFKSISKDAWIVSTYRSHYHALLHGIDPEWLFEEIKAGRSMNIHNVEHRFISSAIVGGCLPIAVGLAATGKKVWCFLGDMAATTGAFHEAFKYAWQNDLPINFVVEDNGFSTNSPTKQCWGENYGTVPKVQSYFYQRVYPHVGIPEWVTF